MPRSLAENTLKLATFVEGTAASRGSKREVQNILTEFGLNPLKFSRKDGEEEQDTFSFEWKTHINKALNRELRN